MFFWRIFFSRNQSKSSLFLLAPSLQPPSMGLRICIFSESHMESWPLACTQSGEGPGWSEWGSACLHSQDCPQPRAQKPSPHHSGQVLMSPGLIPGASLMEKGDSGVLTFLLEESVLLWVWSRCLAHLILWYERWLASHIADWLTPDVSTKNTMWPAAPQWLQPYIHSFTELSSKLYTLVKTPSSPLGGRRGLLVFCSSKSSQEWIWTFRRCDVWFLFK